uniref:SbmA/BacA-like family transporter n=1 Tax=Escherichia coli TaxID=562 RepID=UPI0024C4B104
MLPSETMIWQPEFTDKTLSRKPGAVHGAFQYLINSWTTLVELMSIYKRLRSFEHELDGDKIQEVTHTLS